MIDQIHRQTCDIAIRAKVQVLQGRDLGDWIRRKMSTSRQMRVIVPLLVLGVSVVIAASVAPASIATPGVDRSCHKVSAVTMKLIAGGLKRGRKFSGSGYAVRSGIPPVSQSFNKSFWWIAVRIRGRGVGVWATTLSPSLRRKPPGGTANTLQAANLVAWKNSDWGSFGTFPKNYGRPPGNPPLDNPGRRIALSCVP